MYSTASLALFATMLLPHQQSSGSEDGVVVQDVVYKTIGDREIKYWVYRPANQSEGTAPGIFFVHGGGWSGGSHMQFDPHARHLAAKGLVVASAEYRLTKRDKCKAVDCVADTWDGYRHFLEHAADYGLDAKRVAVGGGSAGGHLSSCLGTGTYPPDAKKTDDPRPVAMFLFNPAVCLAPYPVPGTDKVYTPIGFEKGAIQSKTGCDPIAISPLHHIDAETPPVVAFHGDADTTVGIRSVELFCEAVESHGKIATLHRYPGRAHAFFNRGKKGPAGEDDYADTLVKLDAALVAMGWLEN